MKKFIQLITKTYIGKEFREYIDRSNPDNLDESERWKKDLYENEEIEEVKLPKAHTSRVMVDPDSILSMTETFSLEEMHRNKNNPRYDSVDIAMLDGLQISVVGTLDEIQEQLEEFYNNNE